MGGGADDGDDYASTRHMKNTTSNSFGDLLPCTNDTSSGPGANVGFTVRNVLSLARHRRLGALETGVEDPWLFLFASCTAGGGSTGDANFFS